MKALAAAHLLFLLFLSTTSAKLYDSLSPADKSRRLDAIRKYSLPRLPTLSLKDSPPPPLQSRNGQCSFDQRRRLLTSAIQMTELPPEFQLSTTECYMFLGYHGTCGTKAAASIEVGIRPQPRTDPNHRSQLGEGFYLTQAYEDAKEWGERACELGGKASTETPSVCAIYINGATWMYSKKLFVPRRANFQQPPKLENLWWDMPNIEKWKRHHGILDGQDSILFSFIDFNHADFPDVARKALRQWQMLIPNGNLMGNITAKCSTAPLNPPENNWDALIDGEWQVQGRRRQHRRPQTGSPVHDE
ncbi:hypothetical protein BKA69DRAFT_1164863 [Paraphysoderma sedebokerense]|nr:hypothetical protein BKA69DRAFT_1164863 [Paraphysoderma sedebokerense]